MSCHPSQRTNQATLATQLLVFVLVLLGMTSTVSAQQATGAEGPVTPAQPLSLREPELSTAARRVIAQPQLCANPPRVASGELAQSTVISFSDVLQTLLCTHPAVRQSLASVEQARAAQAGAAAQSQPALTLIAGADDPRGTQPFGSAMIRLDAVLMDFGQTRATLDAARQTLAAALSDQQDSVLVALSAGIERYAAAEVAFGRFEVAARNLLSAQSNARAAEARHAAGAAALSDKLQGQTALAQARLDRVRAANQWLAARGALAVALGLPASHPLLVKPSADEVTIGEPPNVEHLLEEARRLHPKLAAQQARLNALAASEKAVRSQRWGSINLGSEASLVRSTDRAAQSTVRNTGNVSLSWTVPLLDRQVISSRERDLQAQQLSRRAAAEEATAQVELAVWQTAQELRTELTAVSESRQVLANAEAALRVSSERYRAGVGLFADVLAAQSSASNARLQVVESRSGLRRAQWRLAAAVGRLGSIAP